MFKILLIFSALLTEGALLKVYADYDLDPKRALQSFPLQKEIEAARRAEDEFSGPDEDECSCASSTSYNYGDVFIETPPETPAQKKSRLEREKIEEARIATCENQICSDVRDFFKKHPHDRPGVKAYLKGKTGSAAKLAKHIGDFFNERNEYAAADFFYHLANRSIKLGYEQTGAPEAQAVMHISAFNRALKTLKKNKQTAPTTAMFFHMQAAVKAFSLAAYTGDIISEYLYPVARNKRNALVLFHHNRAFAASQAWGAHLLSAQMVDFALHEMNRMAAIFQAPNYNDQPNAQNMAYTLWQLGFCGGQFQSTTQHVWANPWGVMVRIKSNGEFTIGLTHKNPFVWDAHGDALYPVRLAQTNADGFNWLACERSNEITKVVFDPITQAIKLVPSRNKKDDWYDDASRDSTMQQAHFHLSGKVNMNAAKNKLTFWRY